MFEVRKNTISKKKLKNFINKISNNYFPWYLQNVINEFDKSGYGYFAHSLFLDRKINSPFYKWEGVITKSELIVCTRCAKREGILKKGRR